MEEEKAVAYYDELTRKGEGAARFKRGLGFSSGNDTVPSKSSAPSFLSTFVKASSPPQASDLEKQAQLETIKNKLNRKCGDKPSRSQTSGRESSHGHRRSRSRGRDDRKGERYSSKRNRSRSRSRSRSRERRLNVDSHRESERHRDRRRRRSGSRSWSPLKERRLERRRSSSPRRKSKTDIEKEGKERNGGVDYWRLIDGYDKMVCALHQRHAV